MIYSVDVRVTAPVRDTEVADRVADAVTNLFPGATVEQRPGRVVAETHEVEQFSELLHRQEILDAARKRFHENLLGNEFSFSLKKQAAFQGVVNFAVGSEDELGTVDVRVRVDEPSPEEFVDYVAPPTEEGEPVGGG